MRIALSIFLFSMTFGFSQGPFYVATNGNSSNNGTSTATPWSLRHMETRINDGTVPAGAIIHVRAGNYGDTRLILTRGGTVNNHIKIVGYLNTPGDITTTNGPTFSYGDTFSSSAMPTITSSGNGGSTSGEGIWLRANYLWLENFQVTGYYRNIDSYIQTGFVLRNILTRNAGNQNITTDSGRGIIIRGNGHLIENCFDLNSTAQGITLTSAQNVTVRGCKVYNDNDTNPGGYYMLIFGGSENNIVENCTIYRKPTLFHGGHGYVLKDIARSNIVRNSVAYNTGVELNFSEVKNNLISNVEIYGDDTETVRYSLALRVCSGASENTFENIYLENVRYGVEFRDNDDGPAATFPSVNANQGGNLNEFYNIVVNGADRAIQTTQSQIRTSTSNGNKIYNSLFYNLSDDSAVLNVHTFTNTEIVNTLFQNATGATTFWRNARGSSTFTVSHSNFNNVGFSTPSGTNNTTHNPLFVNAEAGNFNLQSSSNLIDSGTAVSGLVSDFNGDPRVVGSGIDRGPMEYQGGAPADVTAPSIVGTPSIDQITSTSFRVEWNLNEGSKGRIYFDTNTGTNIADYPNFTNIENSFLTFHRQTVGGSNPAPLTEGTLYYFRIYLEDAAGNSTLSPEYTVTTLANEGEIPDPPPAVGSIQDLRGLFLKLKKF